MQTIVAVRSAEDKRLGAQPESNIAPQVQGTSRRSRYKVNTRGRGGSWEILSSGRAAADAHKLKHL